MLCALDRIFDDAAVFGPREKRFREKKLETASLQTEKAPTVEPVTTEEK